MRVIRESSNWLTIIFLLKNVEKTEAQNAYKIATFLGYHTVYYIPLDRPRLCAKTYHNTLICASSSWIYILPWKTLKILGGLYTCLHIIIYIYTHIHNLHTGQLALTAHARHGYVYIPCCIYTHYCHIYNISIYNYSNSSQSS